MVLKISLCLLAFIFNLAASNEYSGLLSRLYKKATSENRPLILVLDNSMKDLDDTPHTVKQQKERDVEIDRNVPLNLLELLNQKNRPLKHEHKQSLPYNLPLAEERVVEPSYHQSDLQRLRYRLQKERERRRERRERKNRAHDDVHDKDDDRHQDQNQDREDMQKSVDKRALRTSVIKNLLRTFNDLNCDAKEECEDECNGKFNGKKLDKCEDKCEVKYECEESEKEDPCADKDECDDSEEQTGSTKGERLVTVTEKCKRC